MDISIVIRTKDEAESIGKTLQRVRDQEFSGNYEIIIVDSGSADGTLDIVREYDVRLIQIPEREFTYGRSLNIGASHGKGRYVVNLSAHALPRDEKWLTHLITGFEGYEVAGVYGRQLSIGQLNPFEALQNELFFGETKVTFSVKNGKMLKQIRFSNGNCAIRKDVWESFKFNEQVPYAEDILWQAEVVEAGFSIVYIPDATVYHTHRVSIDNAYKNSKNCAYTLALMKQKRQSMPLVINDVGILLSLIPSSIFQNLRYIWRNNHLEYLKVAPLYLMSGWLGWLVGRIKYRLAR